MTKNFFSDHQLEQNSFYFHSNLMLQVHICILFFSANDSKVTELLRFLDGKCSRKIAIQWYSYYRDVMTMHLANNPPTFNSLVHVDEMAIGEKIKYGHGNTETDTRWLFGIVDKTNHKCYLEFLQDKSHPSIIPIIQHHCRPGI